MLKWLAPAYHILLYTQKKFSCCNGDVQDQDIRTQLFERNSKIYNMSIFWEYNFSLGLELGYPILLHLKKFCVWYGDVQDQDIRTQLVERSSKIYNMSIFWENNFSLGLEPVYPIQLHLKIFRLLTRRPRPRYSDSASWEEFKNI